ncbi:triose-phosphate isomerase [Candidatus Woesearchaeota archaeon]|nr:triose-phosphate isomerase [Candidatus Woesearchaeota archaeon]
MKTPFILINVKTYEQGTGKNAVKLAEICEKVSKEKKVPIAISVQPADIYRVAQEVSIPVWAQHVDSIEYGKNTGFILPESVKAAGASGTLLNHAEHKLDYPSLAAAVKLCKKLKLTTMVCAADNNEAAKVAGFSPDFVAVEPPELIGTGISVSTAKPEIVTSSIEAVSKVKKIPVVCGAGITSGEDVRQALKLGAKGALIASAFTTAKNPEEVLRGLVKFL